MGKASTIIKTTSAVVATTVTLLTALREHPQITQGVDTALAKLKSATRGDHPKTRYDDKLAAIEACALAVEENFSETPEPAVWRVQVKALRIRGELAWSANSGSARRKAMKALTAEATELLAKVNERLLALSGTVPLDADDDMAPDVELA